MSNKVETRGCKAKTYALYKRDEFIEIGTVKEIAEKTGLKIGYLYTMRGNKPSGGYSLDLMEDEEDEV